MRIFISYERDRVTVDVGAGETVKSIKESIRDRFYIGPDEGPAGSEQQDKKMLTLTYAGADLDDAWMFTDIGIQTGATVKAVLRDETKPSVFVYTVFNEEEVPIYEKINFGTTVSEFKSMVSRKTGLPVGAFRMVNTMSTGGLEMFDCNRLEEYGVGMGTTVRLETWDGWNDFLNLCIMGYASHVMTHLAADEVVAKFQLKVALYMAAHFGHVDLAVNLQRLGTRADEPVGEHPLRMWCKGAVEHPDCHRCPVHEAAGAGRLGVLRTFVHANISNVLAKDGGGLTPLNIALRGHQKPCASFLLTKQWNKVGYTKKSSLPLSIYVKMKRWSERAKDKVLMIHGQWKSSVKNPRRLPAHGALLGHGVMLDGFSTSRMTTKPPAQARHDEEEERRRKHVNWRLDADRKNLDPETYFRSLGAITSLKLPKLSRWTKVLTKATQERRADRDREREREKDRRDSVFGENESIATKDTSRGDAADAPSEEETPPQQSPDNSRRRVPRPRSNSTSRVEGSRLRLPPIKETKKVSVSHQNLTGGGGGGATAGAGEKGGGATSGGPELTVQRRSAYLKTGSVQQSQAWSSTRESVSTQSVGDAGNDASGGGAAKDKDKETKDKEQQQEGKTPRKRRKAEVKMAKSRAGEGNIPLPIRSLDNNNRPFVKGGATRETLALFERHRGIKSRDYAIKCLSVANTFRERPWLQQVHQAMHIAERGVKKIVERQPYMFTQEVEAGGAGGGKPGVSKRDSDSQISVATV